MLQYFIILLNLFTSIIINSFLITLTIILFLGVCALCAIFIRPRLSSLAKFPGPKPSSLLFGNLIEVNNGEAGVIHERWQGIYGSVYAYRGLLGEHRLSITDSKALCHVLINKAYDYPKPVEIKGDLGRLLGQGLVVVEDDVHKRQRKLLQPSFSPAHIRDLAPIFHEQAKKLTDVFSKMVQHSDNTNEARKSGRVIDVLPWISRATLDIIGLAAFGYAFNSLSNDENELAQSFSTLFCYTNGQMKPLKLFIFTLLRKVPFLVKLVSTERLRAMHHCMSTMQKISREVLEKKKKDVHIDFDSKDLMSILVKANNASASEKERLADDEVIGQMSTFIFAGHETTASGLTWTLWALAQNLDVQERLRREMVSATAEEETSSRISVELLQNLPYLDAVCRESLRLYAPVPQTFRQALKDDQIPLSQPIKLKDGTFIDHIPVKAGQIMVVSISSYNRSADIFGEDAHQFKPSRWLDDEKDGTTSKKALHHTAGVWSGLLTFLGGPRSCIGYRFSLLEMKVILIHLILAFKFEECNTNGGPDYERRSGIIMRPRPRGASGGTAMSLLISPIET